MQSWLHRKYVALPKNNNTKGFNLTASVNILSRKKKLSQVSQSLYVFRPWAAILDF